MSEELDESVNSTNDTTEEVDKTEEVEETDAQSETEDLEALQEKNKRLFERAKKAEAEAKLLKAERLKKEELAKAQPKAEAPQKQDAFDLEDVATLVQAVPNKEDRATVKEFAKFRGITLEEALNSPIVKQMLKEANETRATANATNTGPTRRGASKPSAEVILANASKGILPDDPEELAEARHQSKFKK